MSKSRGIGTLTMPAAIPAGTDALRTARLGRELLEGLVVQAQEPGEGTLAAGGGRMGRLRVL